MRKRKIQIIFESITFVLFFLVLQAFFQGCDEYPFESSKYAVYGSGRIVEKDIADLSDFDTVIDNTFCNVTILQSDNYKITVRSDDNIIDLVQIYRANHSLVIDIDDRYNYKNCVYYVYIEMPVVARLSANSAGSIETMGTIESNSLRLCANSAGNISANIRVNELHTQINSAGDIEINGSANRHYSTLQSAGNLFAYGLTTDTTYIDVSSAGSARIQVNNYLEANVSSVGSIFYKGRPELNYRTTSLGRVVDSN